MIDCCTNEHKNPLVILLHLIIAVVAVYGIWAHNWYMIIGVIVLAVICCWFCCKCKKPVEEVKIKKKRK
jgi:hypothetical protein